MNIHFYLWISISIVSVGVQQLLPFKLAISTLAITDASIGDTDDDGHLILKETDKSYIWIKIFNEEQERT